MAEKTACKRVARGKAAGKRRAKPKLPGPQSGTGGAGRKLPGPQSGTGGAGRKLPGPQSGTGGAGRKLPGPQSGTARLSSPKSGGAGRLPVRAVTRTQTGKLPGPQSGTGGAGRKLPGLVKPAPRLVDLAPAKIDQDERDRARLVIRRLKAAHPEARVMLHHRNPWQLLISTILAAQCTDAKVNEVAPALFERFPTPEAMAKARLPTLERIVRPTGFFRNKSKSIRNASRVIVERFGGKLPRTMREMLTLPGVARKTANVVLSNALGVNSGVVVDTHNIRLSNRLGFVKTTDPLKIESFWLAAAEKRDWPLVGHLLYCHGQQVCGRKPGCADCVVGDTCPSTVMEG